MFTQMYGERITHMEFTPQTIHRVNGEEREHELSRDCWCNPTVERFNRKTKKWEAA